MMQGLFVQQFKTETRSQKKETRMQHTAEMQRTQRKILNVTPSPLWGEV